MNKNKIRKSKRADYDDIMRIYRYAQDKMIAGGNPRIAYQKEVIR